MPILLKKIIEQSEYTYENETDAYNEWDVINRIPNYEPNTETHCVCGTQINYLFLVRNRFNQNENIVGGQCIEKIIDFDNYDVNNIQTLNNRGKKKWNRKLELYDELQSYKKKYGWEHNLTEKNHLCAFIYVVENFRERKRQLEIFIHNYIESIRDRINYKNNVILGFHKIHNILDRIKKYRLKKNIKRYIEHIRNIISKKTIYPKLELLCKIKLLSDRYKIYNVIDFNPTGYPKHNLLINNLNDNHSIKYLTAILDFLLYRIKKKKIDFSNNSFLF